jgi:tetratricopeptide (TPR) repeat protein
MLIISLWFKTIFLFFFIAVNINGANLEEFYVSFKTGKYQQAVEVLESIRSTSSFEPTRNYLMALCFKNMQQFEKATLYFKLAIKSGNTSKDLFFEYGQTLFAQNDLEKAKRGFKRSYSLYYIAHISELLEDHSSTKRNYVKLIKDKSADKGLRQFAYFRLSELVYDLVKNKFYVQNYIEKFVAPLLEKGIAVDKDSSAASEMRSRFDEILLKHNMHPLLMINGRMLSRKGLTLFATQQYKTDDNVTLQSDAPAVANTATNRSSWISNTEVFASKRFLSGKRFILTPEVRLNYVHYGERENIDVAQNDSYSLTPALRGSYEFSWNKKVASLLFEVEHDYTARDKNREGRRSFFGRSTTFSLGLQRGFFANGDTTIRLRQRNLSSFSDAISGTTTSLSADQLWIRENGHIMIGLFIMDIYRPNSSFNATDSFLFRGDYLIPRLFWGTDLNLSTSVTMLDTKEQSVTRGTERTLDFGIRLQKRISKKMRLAAFANKITNSSVDEENFSYSKQTLGLELRYSW